VNADLLQGFYLGDLLVEPLRGHVSGHSHSAHLPPKAAEALVCLAAKPGEVVTRDELLQSVWGDDHGSTEALSHAVGEIRHALNDRHDDPVYVQTLPKRGYRLLVTPVLVSESTSTVVLGADKGAHVTDLSFLENLKQRGVLETGLAYLIVGWLLIQVADIVFEQLLLPRWVGTFVTVLVIAGFPIAIILSWYLEFRDGRAVVDTLSPGDARKRRFGRTYISVISALAIAGVLVFIYDKSIGLPQAETPAVAAAVETIHVPPVFDNSIAVLPFLNIDGSPTTQIFANGLVDDVITRLARVPGLLVSARGDSHTLEPNTASKKVRDRLRVAMYLEGSVQTLGEEIRVIVQLIDSETGFHVLSRSFDRPGDDFFDIRDEITALTVANVRVALPDESKKGPIVHVDDSTLDAYLLYRRGVDASRQPSVESQATAIEYYDAALEIDPDYAAAHTGKCTAYIADYLELRDETAMTRASASCATALELNPNLDAVHMSLGKLFQFTGRYEEALEEFQQALASNPDNVGALSGTGAIYAELQQPDKAEEILRRATGLQPGNWDPYNRLGAFYFNQGRYADAAEQYEIVVALDNTNMIGQSNLAMAYVYAGDYEKSVPLLERVAEVEPRAITLSNLGLAYYYLGRLDEAISAHTRATEIAPNDHVAWSGLGDALWVAGNEAEAKTTYGRAESLAAEAMAVNPNDAYTMLDIAWISAMLEHPDEAQQFLQRAQVLATIDPVFHYIDALIHVRAGRADAAIGALELAIDNGFSEKTLAVEPLLVPLRGDPRFEVLVNGPNAP
jgi:TolB-like protein/Flp pilus assembly protein TadD/DNA-binding winged helix-turn-helix (wHTH) protein